MPKLRSAFSPFKASFVMAGVLILSSIAHCSLAGVASFADFDRRARGGEPLNVVFFGGSLTWAPTPPIRSAPVTGG